MARGHVLHGIDLFSTALPDDVRGYDWLVVMGGPMGVGDEVAHPFLIAEKAFVRRAVERGVRVLGVCLGAQILAEALGGRVGRNPHKEIGWFPVDLTPEGAAHPLMAGMPPRFNAFHWHGDTFTPPPGSVRLAASAACADQAFALGDRVLGLQFHLESTPESVRELVAHCGQELVSAPFIQPREALFSGPFAELRQLLFVLLDTMALLLG